MYTTKQDSSRWEDITTLKSHKCKYLIMHRVFDFVQNMN